MDIVSLNLEYLVFYLVGLFLHEKIYYVQYLGLEFWARKQLL